MSGFLHWFVIILAVGNVLACLWLIRWSSKRRPGEAPQGEVTGHTWDGNLAEYNNPLPRWWLWMFYLTIAFGLAYLAMFPGLGNFKGMLGWTEVGQYEKQMAQADEKYGPIFARYAQTPIPALAGNPEAMETGRRLFLTYCSACHGSDAGGASGFPSLKDADWLYGGAPEAILASVLDGRNGLMPPMGAALGTEGTDEVANYVWSLSGGDADAALAVAGKPKFETFCASCHGMDGKGGQAVGAPNLTDNIWLYHGSLAAIKKAINEGRKGQMPAHREFLGEDKVHLLAAYVYSLSSASDVAVK